jgi:hypothetical protein
VLGALRKPSVRRTQHLERFPPCAATASEATPGGYYGPDGLVELKGFPVAVPIPVRALDSSVAERLWHEAEQLTRLGFLLNSPGVARLSCLRAVKNF